MITLIQALLSQRIDFEVKCNGESKNIFIPSVQISDCVKIINEDSLSHSALLSCDIRLKKTEKGVKIYF